MAMSHPLDRPIWNALTTHQSELALGDGRARAFDSRYAFFAAAANGSDESLAALKALIPPGGQVWLVEAKAPPIPPGATMLERAPVNQMIAVDLPAATPRADIELLTEADAPAMTDLVMLTRPGPWLERTHQLSPFVGIRIDGRLAAMAGERLHPEGFAEVSAVCTHPDFQGRGLGAALTMAVAGRIAARGETPFLHVYPANTGAIGLYERLGFRLRQTMTLTVLSR